MSRICHGVPIFGSQLGDDPHPPTCTGRSKVLLSHRSATSSVRTTAGSLTTWAEGSKARCWSRSRWMDSLQGNATVDAYRKPWVKWIKWFLWWFLGCAYHQVSGVVQIFPWAHPENRMIMDDTCAIISSKASDRASTNPWFQWSLHCRRFQSSL